jgi:uncharacterized protein (TIGR02598 family)
MHFDLPMKNWHAACPPKSADFNFAPSVSSGANTLLSGQASSHQWRARNGHSGFTLIEIALAMAIFSFALVSMLGLLSVGLKNSRKASIQIAAANILSAIAADIQGAVIENSNDGGYVATTRKLKIKASVLANGSTQITYPAPLIVDEACTPVKALGDTGLLKTFKVNLSAAAPGLAAVKVQIRWPANIPDAKQPEGSLDSLVAIPTR